MEIINSGRHNSFNHRCLFVQFGQYFNRLGHPMVMVNSAE